MLHVLESVTCSTCSYFVSVIMSPPLKRWGHVGLPVSAQFVRSVCVCAFSPSVCPIHFIFVILSSTFYRAGRQTRVVDAMLG